MCSDAVCRCSMSKRAPKTAVDVDWVARVAHRSTTFRIFSKIKIALFFTIPFHQTTATYVSRACDLTKNFIRLQSHLNTILLPLNVISHFPTHSLFIEAILKQEPIAHNNKTFFFP